MKNSLVKSVSYVFSILLVIAALLPYPPQNAQYLPAANRLLGMISSANFNSTADQAIYISHARTYVIRRIVVCNASTSLTLAIGGLYRGTSKTNAIVANTQVYSGLTGSTKYVDLTLAAILATDVRTEQILYFALTTAQGAPATADVLVFGDALN